MSSHLPRDFKGIWICKELWLDGRLSLTERAIMAEIDSLDCGPPYHCYAQNDHFEKMFGVKERTISQAFTKFKRLGFIEMICFDGRKRHVKSNLKTIYANFYGAESQTESNKQIFTGLTSKKLRVSSREDLREKEIPIEIPNKESPIVPIGDSFPRKSKKEMKEEKRPRVWISPSQEEDLWQRLKGDENKLQACYDKLSAWKIDKMIEGGKSDYGAIIKWVIDAVEKDSFQGRGNSNKFLEENKKLAEKVIKIFPHLAQIGHAELKETSIIFSYTGAYEELFFTDNGFKDRLFSRLRKMNLPIEEL